MPEINPVTKDQLFEKKIAENTGSNYNVGDISDVVPVTKDQALLKEIALNSAGQSGDITELKGKVAYITGKRVTVSMTASAIRWIEFPSSHKIILSAYAYIGSNPYCTLILSRDPATHIMYSKQYINTDSSTPGSFHLLEPNTTYTVTYEYIEI